MKPITKHPAQLAHTRTLDGNEVFWGVPEDSANGTSDAILTELDTAAGIQLKPGMRYRLADDLTLNNAFKSDTGILEVPAGKQLIINAPVHAGNSQIFDVEPWIRATGVLTATANFANGETITLGTKTYTFRTAIGTTDGDVLLGATLSDSLTYLMAAINVDNGVIDLTLGGHKPGTWYGINTIFNSAISVTCTATTLLVKSRVAGVGGLRVSDGVNYYSGNSVPTTETCAHASFGGSTLTGGLNGGHVDFGGTFTGPVNVRWFGATGNGDVDDAEAINAAIRSAGNRPWGPGGEFTGMPVFVPGGDYLLEDTVYFGDDANGVSLIGEYQTKSNFIPSPSMKIRAMPMVHFEANNNNRSYIKGMRITGFSGDEPVVGGGFTTGVRIDGHGNQLHIIDNWIDSHYCGIFLHPHSDSQIRGNTHEFNIVLYDCVGINDITIQDNTWYDNGPIAKGPDNWGPVMKFTNCSRITLANNRLICDIGMSTQLDGMMYFKGCDRVNISGNIEYPLSTFYSKTVVIDSCNVVKVTNNQFGRSQLQTLDITASSDVLVQGNTFTGSHLVSTVTVETSNRVKFCNNTFENFDWEVILNYFGPGLHYNPGSPLGISTSHDIEFTSCNQISITGCSFALGIGGVTSNKVSIIGNDSVATSTGNAACRLTDCTFIRHIGNHWEQNDFNCFLMDGGTNLISSGNTYEGSTASYTFVVLKTAGSISPSNIKILGEIFIDAGSPKEDLAVFQCSLAIINTCSGDNGVFIDDSTTERVFLPKTNTFSSSVVTYHVAAPAFGTWIIGDFVEDWYSINHVSYRAGWLYDGSSWYEIGNVSSSKRYGGFNVDAADADALGFYSVGTSGGISRQTIGSVATDPTTTQALANDLRTKLINVGLVKP